MNDDALTRNGQGELALRTVSTSGDNYVDKNDALTRNGQGELALRTVSTSGDNYVDKNDVYTRDDDGKLCVRTVGDGGGGDPVINSLDVTPSTSAQTITPETGVDGFAPVNVSAVDASIDENIVAGNIKSGVDILGVTGTYTGSGPAHYIEKTVSNGSILTNESTSFIDLTGITEIGNSGLFRAYSNNTHITSFDMKNVTVLSGTSAMESCFQSCSAITTANLSPVHTVSGANALTSTFYGCTNLVSAYCDTIVSVTVNNGMYSSFSLCSNLKTASFNKLNVIQYPLAPSYGAVFNNCSKLEDVYLGGLTASTFANAQNQLQYLFNNNTGKDAPNGCTVHFPSNFDPSDPNHTFDASTLTGYPTFNGSASYIHVAFDLTASE